VTHAKGEEAAEATRIRDNLRDQLRDYEGQKAEADREPEARPPPDPRVVLNARNWHSRNSWFDFQRSDFDSKVAGAIDDSIAAEGMDPATPEYWKEFDKRIATVLPHRAKKASNGHDSEEEDEEEDEPPRRKTPPKKEPQERAPPGGPRFRTGGPGRDLKANEVYLSRERIEAMKESGAWEDPVLRAKLLKRYQAYDREHGTN